MYILRNPFNSTLLMVASLLALLALQPLARLVSEIAPVANSLPLSFVPNAGQTDEAVQFQVRSLGGTLFFTQREVILLLADGTANSDESVHVLRMRFEDMNSEPAMRAGEPLSGVVNYFLGNDPANWQTNVPTYGGVIYESLYPGIDLVYDGSEGLLKGTFTVAVGADQSVIRWRYMGAEQVDLDTATGDLRIALPNGNVLAERAPTAWQEIGEVRVPVEARFTVADDGSVGFALGIYDPAYALVLDPVLQYSTYLGGDNANIGWNIAVDSDNNVYVVGAAYSQGYPVQNPIQATHANLFCGRGAASVPCGDIVISKLNAAGDTLLYSTYLGGIGYDVGLDITTDSDRNIYLTGVTSSFDFPTTQNVVQPLPVGDICSSDSLCQDEAFVVKIDADGDTVLYSTYLGGTLTEQAEGIAVDSDGNAYIAGYTFSVDFPTLNALQGTHAGDVDIFISKLNPSASALIFSTYLGGTLFDKATDIGIDGDRNIYISGLTQSTNYPTTASAYQNSYNGGPFTGEALLTKLNNSATTILYSTYIGGNDYESGNALALDSDSNVYLVGTARSVDFPTTAGAFDRIYNGQNEAFAAKIDTRLSGVASLIYSTYLGGGNNEEGFDIAVDTSGNAYLIGITSSISYPVLAAVQSTYGGGDQDAFVTKLNPTGSGLIYSTFLGGTLFETGRGIAIATNTTGISTYVTGNTRSNNFPVTPPAYQISGAGVFVSRIGPGAELALNASDSPDPVVNGSNVNHNYTITNNGPDSASSVTLTINLPASTSFVSATSTQGSCTQAAGVVTCNLGGLTASGPGRTGIVNITISPTTSGRISSSGSVTANETDIISTNNNDVEVTAVTAVVNATNDANDGTCNTAHCSLREAINAANTSPGPDAITFNIPGAGPHTIQPGLGGLPVISDSLVIDGTTQPGYAGTPRIVVDGSLAGGPFVSGLAISGGSSTVRGLVINNFTFAGIFLLGTNGGNVIEGNYIGTDVTGTQARGNRDGVYILNSANNRVGGTALGARNIISGNNDDGVNLEGSGSIGNQIQGNYIGTTANGSAALGNGPDADGGDGIKISGTSANNTIGGLVPGAFNIIAFNFGRGVYIEGPGFSATGNAILSNSILLNSAQGIGLGNDGVTPNDTGDIDEGPNNLQNYPVLHSAVASITSTTITGTLNSAPNTQYRIELFQSDVCDSPIYGEGESFLGAINVTTNDSGTAPFTYVFQAGLIIGRKITSTATNLTTNDTSEFSVCATVTPPSADLSVTQTDSPEAGPPQSPVTYTITVTNNGPDTATGVMLTDDPPDEVNFISATPSQGNCSQTIGIVTCNLGDLTNGTNATVAVMLSLPFRPSAVNQVSVSTTVSDPNPANNSDTETTIVIATPTPTFTPSRTYTPSSTPTPLTATPTATGTQPPAPPAFVPPPSLTPSDVPPPADTLTPSPIPTATNMAYLVATPTATHTPLPPPPPVG